jgi:PilZ domain
MARGQKESSLPFDDERSRARGFVSLSGTVGELRALPTPVTVTDLSAKGCRISGSDLPARSEVWVAIDGYNPIRATVIWQKRGELGCEFYGVPTKMIVKPPLGRSRPLYSSTGPHPLRERLRGKSTDD